MLGSEIVMVVKLREEQLRYRAALEHIAAGNISPAMTFAKKVLAGLSVEEAHRAARKRDRW